MPFAVSLRAPASSVTGSAIFKIRNINSALEYFEAKAWGYDPEDGNKKLVAFQDSYSAGDFKSPNSGDSRPVDTAYAEVTVLPFSTATNYAILPGNVQDSAMTSTTVVGETTVYRGYENTWVSQPGLDTIQYAYQWRVDGSPIGGENGSRYGTSFGTTGNYVLSVINTRSDLTADTLYKNISVVGPPITATILGGSEVLPNIGSCYFYALASGGNGSYSYQWKKNGTPIGSDSPDLYVSTGTSDFTLSVTISEFGFTTGEDEHYVTVSGGAPEEACNVFD